MNTNTGEISRIDLVFVDWSSCWIDFLVLLITEQKTSNMFFHLVTDCEETIIFNRYVQSLTTNLDFMKQMSNILFRYFNKQKWCLFPLLIRKSYWIISADFLHYFLAVVVVFFQLYWFVLKSVWLKLTVDLRLKIFQLLCIYSLCSF